MVVVEGLAFGIFFEERLLQALPPPEIADCGRRLKACSDEIEMLEEKWLDVSTALEELGR